MTSTSLPPPTRRSLIGLLLGASMLSVGAQTPLRILCVGDSMTAGQERPHEGFRSYRGALQRHLSDAGIAFTMLGSQLREPAIGGDPHHEGYGGARIGTDGSHHNIFDRLDIILGPGVDPDVVVLSLGWNSVFQEPEEAARKYVGLVKEIAKRRPHARLVIATLSPQRGFNEDATSGRLPGYRALNAAARTLAREDVSARLALADLAVAGFEAKDYFDTIHWTQSGADRAGRVIFQALSRVASLAPR